MSGRSNPLGKILDHPWYIVGVVVSVAIVYWAIGTRTQSHYIRANFSTAFNLAPGLDVQVDGRDIGKLGKVDYQPDGTAMVELGIDDDDYWPMYKGTKAIMRYGTTIGNGTRYIDLQPGPTSGEELGEDGIIPLKDSTPVVDVDEIINVFTASKRKEVQTLTKRLDQSFDGEDVNEAIRTAGPGVQAASGFLKELGSDGEALKSLVINTRRSLGNLAERSETVKDFVTVTAATFDEFAQNTDGMERALTEAPSTFREARTTLRRVDDSLGGLDALLTDLRPGARQLPPLAKAATPALRELRRTVPSGLSTVRSLRQASPSLRRLLTVGQPFLSQLGSVSEGLAPQVSCIRPYAPEAMGTVTGLTGWTQGYGRFVNPAAISKARNQPTQYDSQKFDPEGTIQVHGLRALPVFSARSAHIFPEGISSEAFSKLTGTAYAYPRPPGVFSGQPWFQPNCDLGTDTVDPGKDPEQR